MNIDQGVPNCQKLRCEREKLSVLVIVTLRDAINGITKDLCENFWESTLGAWHTRLSAINWQRVSDASGLAIIERHANYNYFGRWRICPSVSGRHCHSRVTDSKVSHSWLTSLTKNAYTWLMIRYTIHCPKVWGGGGLCPKSVNVGAPWAPPSTAYVTN